MLNVKRFHNNFERPSFSAGNRNNMILTFNEERARRGLPMNKQDRLDEALVFSNEMLRQFQILNSIKSINLIVWSRYGGNDSV